MSERLAIGISPCPNDTFAFHGLLAGKVDPRGFAFDVAFADVEELNRALAAGRFDAAKASFHAALRMSDRLAVLGSGAALGFGVGPLLLARPGAPVGAGGRLAGRVLCPGEWTTAALLYGLFRPGEGEVEQRVFSQILPALERGEADYGVCIHEGRFTWQGRGLELVEDLGARWEETFRAPLPLGGILGRKRLGEERLARLAAVIRESIAYGFAHREEALATMRAHAQELDDRVLWSHVELYVNDDTRELSPSAERALAELGARARASGAVAADLPPLAIVRAAADERLFRIAGEDERALLEQRRLPEWSARTLGPEGFVHLSWADQLAGTLALHFARDERVLLLEVDRERVRGCVAREPSRGGALFPHLQRALREADLVRAWPLAREGGRFEPPALGQEAADDRPSGRAWG